VGGGGKGVITTEWKKGCTSAGQEANETGGCAYLMQEKERAVVLNEGEPDLQYFALMSGLD